MEDLLRAHSIDDAIWGCTDPRDMSINTANSAEIMTGSQIREEQTFTFRRSDPYELLNVAAHVPHKDDLSWYDRPYFLDNYHNQNKLLKAIDTSNSTENMAGVHVTNREHQNYYDRRDQRFIACKNNGGLEQVTQELAPGNIVVVEEEDEFYQWADQYDQWDTTPYTPVTDNDVGGSHTFNFDNPLFNLTKIKRDGTSKTRVVSKLSESNNKSDFYIGKRQS